MYEWIVPVATAILAAAATITSAWLALRAKRSEAKEAGGGWSVLSTAWEKRLASLETSNVNNERRIDELEEEVRTLQSDLRVADRLRWLATLYARQLLSWIIVHRPADVLPPRPPDELADELAPLIGNLYGTEPKERRNPR